MLTRASDAHQPPVTTAGSNDEPDMDLGTEIFPDGECEDEDYRRVDFTRFRGALQPAMTPRIKVAAMKVARAFGHSLAAGPVALAPYSAATRVGAQTLTLSVAREGWQARVCQGLVGFGEKVHLWAKGATPLEALNELVRLAQERGKAAAVKKAGAHAAAR